MSLVGWSFDNTYINLPKIMFSKLDPEKFPSPKKIIFNYDLADALGLNFSKSSDEDIASIFVGNSLPTGAKTIAQSYAGHQFGFFTNLGDGRALLVGEHLTPNNIRYDIQLKGSGRTPYSRGGDGRAALGPMLREYIISEAMHYLKIPTTRSLAVVETGEKIIRDRSLSGAVLTRVALSHIRIGTFQFLSMKKDFESLKKLVSYSIERHFPNLKEYKNPTLELLRVVLEKQARLVVEWQRVGFVHGVMNTDNVSICGETIDYGPCAFMDLYDPKTVFSSVDHHGRYSYGNQPVVTHWNLARFAETIIPLIDGDLKVGVNAARNIIDSFTEIHKKYWVQMMKKKLGLFGDDFFDEKIINDFLKIIENNKMDYTNAFTSLLRGDDVNNDHTNGREFNEWRSMWINR